jgi:hypothetical protein
VDNLLRFAIDAHGGMNDWNRLQSLSANVSIGGALWDLKQVPGLFKNARVGWKLHSQHVVMHVPDHDERIVFTPSQMTLESEAGKTPRFAHRSTGTFRRAIRQLKVGQTRCGVFCKRCALGISRHAVPLHPPRLRSTRGRALAGKRGALARFAIHRPGRLRGAHGALNPSVAAKTGLSEGASTSTFQAGLGRKALRGDPMATERTLNSRCGPSISPGRR